MRIFTIKENMVEHFPSGRSTAIGEAYIKKKGNIKIPTSYKIFKKVGNYYI